jgi:hypothetical protein
LIVTPVGVEPMDARLLEDLDDLDLAADGP